MISDMHINSYLTDSLQKSNPAKHIKLSGVTLPKPEGLYFDCLYLFIDLGSLHKEQETDNKHHGDDADAIGRAAC